MRIPVVGTRLVAALLAAALPLRVAAGPPGAAYPEPPQVLFKDLFAAVELAGIYADSKSFADAIPDAPPSQILQQYHAAHPVAPQALKAFSDVHFTLPAELIPPASLPQRVPIAEHIDALWGVLTRDTRTVPRYGSLLALPQPYVVPGGRFREIYYWDSYFTMLGLEQSGRHDLVEDMLRDFAYLIDTYGHVPNGARSYYLSRSQPPFFFAMVALLGGEDPAAAFARFLPQLKGEYAFWMQGSQALRPGTAHRRVVALADGSILNRYWDDRDTPRDESYREDFERAGSSGRPPHEVYRNIRAAAESGWDFSSRWFADAHSLATIDTVEILPVDLNSLLFGLESAIGSGCERTGDHLCKQQFERRAQARRAAMDRYLWSEPDRAYLDYRWTQRAAIARLSAATLYPLFVGAASKTQAQAVAATTSRVLLRAGGIVTTPLDTGQQWDAPNGWAPIQWIAIDGLRRYDENTLAEQVACRWMSNVESAYERSGKLVEKYDVISSGQSGGGGEYPLQDGFGWTNGVMRKLIALYPGVPPVRCREPDSRPSRASGRCACPEE